MKIQHYLILCLICIFAFQCSSSSDNAIDEETIAYTIVLGGEALSANTITVEKSERIQEWMNEALEGKEFNTDSDLDLTIPRYMVPYQWLSIREYVEDLAQLQAYKQAGRNAIQARQTNLAVPESWEEYGLAEARYPLVRKYLMDSEGKQDNRGDATTYLNPFFQALQTEQFVDQGNDADVRGVYEALLPERKEGSHEFQLFFEEASNVWRGQVGEVYQQSADLLVESMYLLRFPASTDAVNNASASLSKKRAELSSWYTQANSSPEAKQIIAQLGETPLPEETTNRLTELLTYTQQQADILRTRIAQLKARYPQAEPYLNEQEKQLFAQVFTHCDGLTQVQEELITRLTPYQTAGSIALLSIVDVLHHLKQILQSAQADQYAEIESILHALTNDYYEQVRQAEKTFLR